MNVKLWSTLACATLVAGAPATAQETASPYPGGTIEHQMEKIFEGEGGEAGLGMTKLVPSFSVPALRSDQLAKVLSGNTVRSNNRFAIYFAPGGSAEGWVIKYRPTAMADCTSKKPAHFVDDAGTCLGGYEVKINSQWRIQNDQICMPGLFHGAQVPPTRETCHYMALVLNSVLFFTSNGDMLGKGWNLAKGDVRAKII